MKKIVLALMLAGVAAHARAADVALLTQLAGEVTVTSSGKARAATPLQKLVSGDRLSLARTARVQLVYFDSARQEVFQGAGRVEIGASESKSALTAEVKKLPAVIVNQLARTPVTGEQGKAGMIRFRGGPDGRAVALLEQQYQELKKDAAPGDATPEVFLLSGLHELRDTKRINAKLDAMTASNEHAAVVAHFRAVLAREASP